MTSGNSIVKISVLVGGLFLAVVLGQMLATDQLSALLWLAGGGVLAFGIALGRNIWAVVPAGVALGLTLMIPGRPDTLMLGNLMFLGFGIPLLLLRRLPLRVTYGELDLWILIVCLFVLQVYLRNPVGLNLFGGSSVGARPYVVLALTLMSYVFLSNYRMTAVNLKWILRIHILGNLLAFGLSIIGYFVPSVGVWYGGGPRQGAEEAAAAGRATRIGFLGSFAEKIALWVSSFKSPLKACFSLRWAPLVLLSMGFAAMSGFRNDMAALGLTYIIGIAYRGGIGQLMLSVGGLGVAICALAVINLISPLPPNVQRSLSFLPGTWQDHIVRDAEGSVEWRVEIWEEVMFTDRWISNKWLGDGLGFSRQELIAQAALRERGGVGVSGFDAHRESILANGDYHSGPIHTIRTIGYFGLVALLLAQIRLAVHAHRQIRRCRGTEWFPLALLIGIPLIWAPVFFVFVFGTFSSAFLGVILGSAFVKILQSNLPLPRYVPPRRQPYVPMGLRRRAAIASAARTR